MQQYVTDNLRHLADKRVRLKYNTGVQIIGTVIATLPEQGEPYLVILEDVDILDPDGDLLEQHNMYSVVPGNLLTMDEYRPV